ncbi:MAG: hypothetical protein Q9208_007365 [Pyrenodesmia sp. 3 TL-2023]
MESRREIFAAILTGDLDIVTKCVAAGCDVNRTGEDGYTPLCTAIRNGEVEIACFLIPHAQIFLKETRAKYVSKPAALWSLFWTGQREHLVDNKVGNWILNTVCAGVGFLVSHVILNFLLARFDVTVMSALHIKNFSVYSALRTRFFRGSVARLVFPANSGPDKSALSPGRQGLNLNAQGSSAFDLIIGYGGDIEAIALQMLAHGMKFDGANDPQRGPARLLWMWAASRGHLRVIMALQAMNFDTNMDSNIALRLACNNQNYDLCKYLVSSGASHKLVALSILEILVFNNADLNQAGCGGRTALGLCCGRSWLERLAQYLLGHAADPDIADEDGNRSLHHAATLGTPSLVKMLIAYGASPTRRNKEGRLHANHAACDGCSVETLDILLQAFNATQCDRDAMLFEAMKYGYLEMLQYLLDKGANPNIEKGDESCALFKAIDRNWQAQEAVIILLQRARADFTTKSGKTALHHLVTGYRVMETHGMITLLVEHGANLEALREYRNHEFQTTDGCLYVTPLWEACMRHDFEYQGSGASKIAEMLIQSGANAYIKSQSGEIVLCTSQQGRETLRKDQVVEAAPKP